MNTNEWLAANAKLSTYHGFTLSEVKPRAVCSDGFFVSIQASHTHYCSPREDVGPYYKVELGYPSAPDELITPFAEDAARPTETVYGYVPIEVVDALLEKHGGIVSKTPGG